MSNFVTSSSSSSSSPFDDVDVVEHTLVQIRNVHVFQVPRIVNSGGHRAADFQQEVWQGNLKIVEKKMEAAIFLLDGKDNSKIFAVCPIVDEGSVERCIDSSRYYVLKIKNQQGKHAFIGLAFDTRDQAFDFNVALQEYEKDKQREKDEKEGKLVGNEGTSSQPSRDLSLKEGQKLSISLPGSSKKKRSPKTTSQSNTGGGLITLAPPPTDSTGENKFGSLVPPPGGSGSLSGTGESRRRGVKVARETVNTTKSPTANTNENTTIGSPNGFSPGAWDDMKTALSNTNSSTSTQDGNSDGFSSFPSDPFGSFSPTAGTQNNNNNISKVNTSTSKNTDDDLLDFLGT